MFPLGDPPRFLLVELPGRGGKSLERLDFLLHFLLDGGFFGSLLFGLFDAHGIELKYPRWLSPARVSILRDAEFLAFKRFQARGGTGQGHGGSEIRQAAAASVTTRIERHTFFIVRL
jgi:hypothetical protein